MELIVTNNPKVLALCPWARWIDGDPLEVLRECRKRVQEGYSLLSHPLMGDIHLLRNPFRTVILDEKREEIDLTSLGWIEESTERVRSFNGRHHRRENLDDYQTLDLDLFRTTVDQTRGLRGGEGQAALLGFGSYARSGWNEVPRR